MFHAEDIVLLECIGQGELIWTRVLGEGSVCVVFAGRHACVHMPNQKRAVVIITPFQLQCLNNTMFLTWCCCTRVLHVVWTNRNLLLESELSQYKGKCVVFKKVIAVVIQGNFDCHYLWSASFDHVPNQFAISYYAHVKYATVNFVCATIRILQESLELCTRQPLLSRAVDRTKKVLN